MGSIPYMLHFTECMAEAGAVNFSSQSNQVILVQKFPNLVACSSCSACHRTDENQDH